MINPKKKKVLIGFATSDFKCWAYIHAFFAYYICGFDAVTIFEPTSIRIKSIDWNSRGAGYWVWKPLIIKRLLDTFPLSILVYTDMGKSWRYIPLYSAKRIQKILSRVNLKFMPGVFIPEHGPNKRWTKFSVFKEFKTLNNQCVHNMPQVQATWSIWTQDEYAMNFINIWNRYCQVKDLIDDSNSYGIDSSYRDHRHDQSILTQLVFAQSSKLLFDQEDYVPFSKYFSFVLCQFEFSITRPLFLCAEKFRKTLSDIKSSWKKI